MKKEPLVSVVIPTYNRKQYVTRLINSILENSYKNIEILVVNDASTDGTQHYLKERFKYFPKIKVLNNRKNMLLAGSRNHGIREAVGDLILLVDDDNVLDKMCIQELVNAMFLDKRIGMVGPVMYYWKNKKKIWWAGTKRNMITSRTNFIGRNLVIPKKKVWSTDDFPNMFMIKREVILKVGILDDTVFAIQYDEADYGTRVRRAGYKCIVVRDAFVYHDMPLSNEENKDRVYHVYDERRAYYMGKNRIIFHKKYSSWWQFLIFIFMFQEMFTLYYLVIILFGSKKSILRKLNIAKMYLKGVVAGFKR